MDVLFQNEISLGAKCLVVYNLQVLNESSPLQQISRRRASDKNDNRDNKPLARKVNRKLFALYYKNVAALKYSIYLQSPRAS